MTDEETAEFRRLVEGSPWLTAVLATVRDSGLPDAWVGAGVLRDLVWGERFGAGCDPGRVRDVDVVFLDPGDLSRSRDDAATAWLADRHPGVPWEAKNQAAVHTWYQRKFGGPPVAPFDTIAQAVASWPETATAVAVRLDGTGVDVCAPLGLGDLMSGVWRRNPRRISVEASRRRLARHRPADRYPGVRVVEPEQY